jgi:hypothetical protein
MEKGGRGSVYGRFQEIIRYSLGTTPKSVQIAGSSFEIRIE